MRFAIISGSHRENSQSERIGTFIASRISQTIPGGETYFLSLGNNPLPLWDESIWEDGPVWKEKWEPIADELKNCDGLVLISPEWHGMVPSGLKNFLLCCSKDEVGHKPGLIISVSSSRNGAYPVTELRASGYKNNRLCYIPEHLIVRDAETMFVGEAPQNGDDAYLRKRLDFCLQLLGEYAQAMKSIRTSGRAFSDDFPSGM